MFQFPVGERSAAFGTWMEGLLPFGFRNAAFLQPVGLRLCPTAFLSSQVGRSAPAHSSALAEIPFSRRTSTPGCIQASLHKVYVSA